MSWSVTTQSYSAESGQAPPVAVDDLQAALDALEIPYVDPTCGDEMEAQLQEARVAAIALVKSGALGEPTHVHVSLSGHATPSLVAEHTSSAPPMLTVSVSVQKPPAEG